MATFIGFVAMLRPSLLMQPLSSFGCLRIKASLSNHGRGGCRHVLVDVQDVFKGLSKWRFPQETRELGLSHLFFAYVLIYRVVQVFWCFRSNYPQRLLWISWTMGARNRFARSHQGERIWPALLKFADPFWGAPCCCLSHGVYLGCFQTSTYTVSYPCISTIRTYIWMADWPNTTRNTYSVNA